MAEVHAVLLLFDSTPTWTRGDLSVGSELFFRCKRAAPKLAEPGLSSALVEKFDSSSVVFGGCMGLLGECKVFLRRPRFMIECGEATRETGVQGF